MMMLDDLVKLKQNTLRILEYEREALCNNMANPRVINVNAKRIKDTIVEITVLGDAVDTAKETGNTNTYEVLLETLQSLQGLLEEMREEKEIDCKRVIETLEADTAALEKIIATELEDPPEEETERRKRVKQ